MIDMETMVGVRKVPRIQAIGLHICGWVLGVYGYSSGTQGH